MRALCRLRPPYGVRELARRTGIPPASVSRVVTLLEREAIVVRGARNGVVSVDEAALFRTSRR